MGYLTTLGVLLMVTLLAILIPNFAQADGSTTRNCCLPEVFTAFLGSHGGFPADDSKHIFETEKYVQFDYPNRRWAAHATLYFEFDETMESFWIQDFKKRTITVGRYSDKEEQEANICYIIPMQTKSDMNVPCLPSKAEYQASHRVAAGDSSLTYDVWSWESGINDAMTPQGDCTDRRDITFFVSYFQETCAPHQLVAFYRDQNNFLTTPTIELLNMELSIPAEEDSIFAYPTRHYNCKKVKSLPRFRYNYSDDVELLDFIFHGDSYKGEGSPRY